MLLNHGVGEDSWELLDCKEIQPVHPKGDQSWDWCWSWNSNTLAMWCEELTHWKRPWGWERLTAGGEGDDRGWDGWMASPTQWTWVWVDSGSWWWTGRPGMLWFIGSQGVGYDWMSELNWTGRYLNITYTHCFVSDDQAQREWAFIVHQNWMEVTASHFFGVLQERHLNSFLKCLLH